MFDKFHDECGVFGIFGHPEAANLTYLGLYALQHRGQESAGIAASDGTQIRVSKAMGYVNEVFDSDTLAAAARAHRDGPRALLDGGREPARQRAADRRRQRSRAARRRPQRQPGQRRRAARRAGARRARSSRPRPTPKSSCTCLRARAQDSAEAAIVEALSQVRGAYSFVMMTKDRLIGVRDPHGFRPLAIGRLRRRLGDLLRDLRAWI